MPIRTRLKAAEGTVAARPARMNFELSAGLLAGLVAGAVMVAYRATLRELRLRLELDVAQLWGTMLLPAGTAAQALGMTIHLVGSALLALPYAWAFATMRVAPDAAWSWGLLGGTLHWLVAGATMGVVPLVHPRVPDAHPAPGWFVIGFGRRSALVFLGGHLLYGLVVAGLYAWLV